MILDTIDRFSQMESLSNFAILIGEEYQKIWEDISTYLYLLLGKRSFLVPQPVRLTFF